MPIRHTPIASWARRGALAAAASVALLGGIAMPAHAADQADTYAVEAVIHADGSLDVQATIGFAAPPASLTQRFALASETTGERDYVYQVSAVTVGGQPAQVATSGDTLTVTIPTAGATSVVLGYHVVGAAQRTGDGSTAVTWDFLQGLSVPVAKFTTTVSLDALAQFSSIDCKTGTGPDPSGACTMWGGGTHDTPNPFFEQDGTAAGERVRVTVLFAGAGVAVNEVIRERWTLGRAFSPGPLQVGIALVIVAAAIVGLLIAHRRFGRDAAGGEPVRIAEFHPVGEGMTEFRVLHNIRPGHVGTVLDERVDPIDVTATLLDLAVRGYLRIHELPRARQFAMVEWTFERLGKDTAELAPFELTLLDAVAPAGGEPATVSALADHIGPVVSKAQSQLYDDVVTRGWFARRPDVTRSTWGRIGWIALAVAVVVTGVLLAVTTYGLVGLALIVAALALLFVGAEMPARTPAGTGVLRGLHVLAGQLATQPTDEAQQGKELEQLSAIVPYAVVLGGARRWLDAIERVCPDAEPDPEDLYWYHAPEGWHLSDLPASLNNFLTIVQGKLFSR